MSTGNENENMNLQGDIRHKEVVDFWNMMNCKNINLIFSKEKYISELREDQWVNKIENLFSISKYDFILIPSIEDNHCEHRLVSNVGRSLARSKPITLIEYQTPSTNKNWIYNLSVDIGEYVFNKKTESLSSAFINQVNMGRSYFSNEYSNIAATDCILYRKKLKYVEKFKILECYL